MSPAYELKRQVTQTTKTYEITGAPAYKIPHSKTAIKPHRLVITIISGSVSSVKLGGGRLKKDGTPGETYSERTLYSRRDWPGWLLPFIEGMGL